MSYKLLSTSFIPPEIHSFIQEPYWEIHEAIYVLIGEWPKSYMTPTLLWNHDIELPLKRSTFYLPHPDNPFKSTKFQEILSIMQASIKMGELDSYFGYSNNITTYLLVPEDVIIWSIKKSISLPHNLQNTLKIYEMINSKTSVSKTLKVQRKVIAQFIIANNPTLNRTEICHHPLMSLFGTLDRNRDQEFKAVRRAINELYNLPGKRGRPAECPQQRRALPYSPIAIPEVLIRHSSPKIKFL